MRATVLMLVVSALVLSPLPTLAQDTPADPAALEQELNLPRETRMLVQKGLAFFGFDPGPADGLFGPKTRAAIWDWQAAKELDTTGYLTMPEAEALAAVGMETGETPDVEVQDSVTSQLPVGTATESKPGDQILYFATCGTDNARRDGCWFPLAEPAACVIWEFGHWDFPPDSAKTWTGECDDTNRASGWGTLTWKRPASLWADSDDPLEGSETGEYVAGMRQGKWKEEKTYENDPADKGDLLGTRRIGPYVDGERHGEWVEERRWEDGRAVTRTYGPYVEGLRHGDWVKEQRLDDGTVKRHHGPYMEGLRHGDWVEEQRWENRVAEGYGPYVEGEKHGWWVTTWFDGSADSIHIDEYRHGEEIVDGAAGSILKSEEGHKETLVQFVNAMNENIDVFWIDYEGKRQFWFTLGPGARHEQTTYVTHPWLVLTSDDATFAAVIVGDVEKQTITVSGSNDREIAIQE